MDLQPTLENDLIRIRPLTNLDLEPLYEVAKDPKLWEQHPCNRYLRTEYEEFFLESIQSKGALAILDKSSEKIIGGSRFKKVDGFPNGVEIGWSFLSRNYWGGKYNQAMKKLMLDHAFKSLENVIFFVDQENIRSQKAVEKIGGQKLTTSQSRHLLKSNEADLIYRINKKDWAIG